MRKLILSAILAIPFFEGLSQKQIHVDLNQNMELLGLVYTIVYENPKNDRFDNTDPDWEYGKWLISNYGDFGQSQILREILPSIEHLWIGDFFYLLTNVNDFPHAQLNDRLDTNELVQFSPKGDMDEALEIVQSFLNAMNRFYDEVNFDQYLKSRNSYYEVALDHLTIISNKSNVLGSMESFYGQSYEKYMAFISLTLPPGMGFAMNDDKNSYVLLTAQNKQDLNEWEVGYEDEERILELIIHEAGHNLLSPTFKELPSYLFSNTEHLFPQIRNEMQSQNYLSWYTTVNEHITRAGEIVTARNMGDTVKAARLYDYHTNEKAFIYLPIILNELSDNYSKKGEFRNGVLRAFQKLQISTQDPVDSLEKTVSGIVTIKGSHEPFPYVHIGVIGKNLGVISKLDGTFQINLSGALPSDSLAFSSVGFKKLTFAISDISSDTMFIQLEEDVRLLKEIKVIDQEIVVTEKMGRTSASKTTSGQNGLTDYGFGGEHGIRINKTSAGYLLQDVNFHMRFNTADSILFRINIYNIINELPCESILSEELFMKSYKGKKWIRGDFSENQIVIDQDVIITYEVVRIWYSERGNNNIFFTFGKDYEEGGVYSRQSSFDSWEKSHEAAFPIALYITGRTY